MKLSDDHGEGFEKEDLFHEIFGEAYQECPGIKPSTVKKIISRVAPEFLNGCNFLDYPD